jgi:hypothetical protein
MAGLYYTDSLDNKLYISSRPGVGARPHISSVYIKKTKKLYNHDDKDFIKIAKLLGLVSKEINGESIFLVKENAGIVKGAMKKD